MTSQTASNGCAIKPVLSVKPRTVSVNGVTISRSAIAQEIQNHPASKATDAWLAAARALAVRELLLQEARRLHVSPEPVDDGEGRRETDDEACVRMLIAAQVKTPEADEAICRRYYEANASRFRTSDLYEVRHILLPAADEKSRAAQRQRAAVILEVLEKAPSQFAAIAAEESACPSAKVGGNLGQIGTGQTVAEFETALRGMNEGEVASVETRYGLHVVALDHRITGRQLPFEMVQARIAEWLNEKVQRNAIRQYISILAGKAVITGIEMDASPSPLVQ